MGPRTLLRAWGRHYADACRDLPRPIWHIALVALVSRSGQMVLPYLLLYLIEAREFSKGDAGLVLAGVGLAGMAGQQIGGAVADRVGPRSVQIVTLFGAALLYLGIWALPTAATLVVGLLLLSLVGEAFRPANLAAISGFTTAVERPRAIALQRLAVNVGVTFGPIVGGFLADLDYDYLFLVNGAVWLVSAVLLTFLSRSWPEIDRTPPQDDPALDRSPWRDRVLLVFLLVNVSVAFCFMQFQSGMTIELREGYGFDKSTIGVAFAMNTVLIVLFEMPLWKKLAGRDNLVLCALGAALTGVGIALTPLGSTLAFAWATVAVWTLGEMLHATSSWSFVAERAGPRYRGRYMGAMGASFGLAVAVAPIAGTQLYDSGALWWLCAALGLFAAALSFALRPHVRRERASR
ncbi:MAG: MFS transporter [Planctomycetota bacterium]